jgi:hypothetical protein
VQSPQHLLLSCPNHKEERRRLRESTKLKRGDPFAAYFQGEKRISALLEFIRDTGIATRDWWLKGEKEEEEEDEESEKEDD